MEQQKPWQVGLEIVALMIPCAFGLLIWIYVGAEDLGRWWSWQWLPYVDFYDTHLRDFFRSDGRPYTTVVVLVAAFALLCLSLRLSIWFAKLVVAFTLTRAVLGLSGALTVDPPEAILTAAAVAAVGWIILGRWLQTIQWGALLRPKPFGSARWASWFDLRRAGLLQKGGLFLGRSRGRDLYHNAEGHIITVGGAGGGKSTGLVVPALLELDQGSIIVTDPSGELAAITSRHRATKSRVVMLNPFHEVFREGTGLDYTDTGFNPLSIIDPALSTFKADCDVLARYLMVTDRKESGSYWNDEGAELLSLMIAATALYERPRDRTLTTIYERVRMPYEKRQEWLHGVFKKGHPSIRSEAMRFADLSESSPNQWDGIASKAALATKRYAPATPLGDHVCKDGFDAADLKRDKVTIYVLVPSGQLTTALPWMNMLMGVFGIAVGRPGEAAPVTLLIDEAPALGYLPDLIPFMAQFRKAGLRVWVFTQTMAQLAADELYGRNGFDTISGLCSIKQYFSIREDKLAKTISDMAGQKTADNISRNAKGENIGDVGVPLIRPEAVRGLRKWRQIIVHDELANPIKGKLVPYFRRRAWNAVADLNPYRSKYRKQPDGSTDQKTAKPLGLPYYGTDDK